jgi:hypothetical protein
MALIDCFEQVEAEIRRLANPMAQLSEEAEADYLLLANALRDWQIVCRRYERNFRRFREVSDAMSRAFEGSKQGTIVRFEESQTHFLELSGELTIDICCFYIFAQIARRACCGLIARLSRKRSRELEKEFKVEFESQLKWFDEHVKFYRDTFIEHPKSIPRANALGCSQEGARLGHTTGKGLNLSDVETLGQWREELKTQFPELGATAGWRAYDWICDNLEKLPEVYRDKARRMIKRVGTVSDSPEDIAPRVAKMFVDIMHFLRLRLREISGANA